MVHGNQLRHGSTVILQKHFLPVPKNAAVADPKTFTDFFDAQAAHGEFKNFPAARRQSDGRHIRFRLFSELVQ